LKKSNWLALIVSCLFCTTSLFAQKLASDNKKTSVYRCATTEAIQQRLRKDPAYYASYQQKLKEYQRSRIQSPRSANSSARLTSIVTIPVVVHIVLPNPQVVTDADVQFFINRLNLDFSGLNPDSTNGAPFFGVRGHSLIRFALAQRDSTGKATTGIIRKATGLTIDSGEPQSVKNKALGGSAPWPYTDYYNIWVGDAGDGLLGIAPEIGPGTSANDGVCINYKAFANNNCYTYSTFTLARTAVHEIGHNFGLFHIFEGGCDDLDFQQLTTPGLSLPQELLSPADDTPAQADQTTSCASGILSTGCSSSPIPSGRMYQNFMDYTDDACYSMFTKGQVERMHYVLQTLRPGYLTTKGHIPVTAPIVLDASVFESVNPGGQEINGCAPISYASSLLCSGNIAPKFRVRNNGTETINTLTVGYRLNNGNTVIRNVTINLPANATTVISFSATPVTIGTNQFKFFTSLPNGVEDIVRNNDTLVATLTIETPISAPITEHFEGEFPPKGWTINNPDNDITWQKGPMGRSSAGSAFINNFNYISFGQKDDLYTPVIQFGIVDSIKLSFDLSAAVYSDPDTKTDPIDTLEILVTNDCGNSFTSVYKKWGAALQTLGQPAKAFTNEFFPENTNQWRTENIDLTTFKDAGPLVVAFRNTTNWDNNIFIDNVQIKTPVLPPLLKEKGYLVLPTVNNGQFAVWLYRNHQSLRYIAVFNSAGVLVWKKEFNGNADAYNLVNLQGQSAGLYFVKWGLEGDNRSLTERIIIK
jgi:hypothetical protein